MFQVLRIALACHRPVSVGASAVAEEPRHRNEIPSHSATHGGLGHRGGGRGVEGGKYTVSGTRVTPGWMGLGIFYYGWGRRGVR